MAGIYLDDSAIEGWNCYIAIGWDILRWRAGEIGRRSRNEEHKINGCCVLMEDVPT